MGNLAIIPARGGSKRIPRKNIKEFCGKPIIAYAIEAALKSGIFEEVMVSTDDVEVVQIAKQYGASVPFLRSEATANDYAPLDDVMREVLREYEKRGRTFEYFFCLYPTSPFISREVLQGMWQQLQENPDADSSVAMIPYNFPPQRAMYVNENGRAVYLYPEHAMTRSQDLIPCINDAGMCYTGKVSTYLGTIEGIDYLPYLVPPVYAQDIDTEEDWQMAEFKYQWIHRNK